jgi:hypothetical protein
VTTIGGVERRPRATAADISNRDHPCHIGESPDPQTAIDPDLRACNPIGPMLPAAYAVGYEIDESGALTRRPQDCDQGLRGESNTFNGLSAHFHGRN